MKTLFVPIALTLALGLAGCAKSNDTTNTAYGSDVVLNDEDAIAGNDLSAAPLGNGTALDAGNTAADAGTAANASLDNASPGNAL